MAHFAFFQKNEAEEIRMQLEKEKHPERIHAISGSDIDSEAIRLANLHINQAHLEGRIPLSVKPLQTVNLSEKGGVFLCNPPYGERLSDRESCHILYHDLRLLHDRHPTWVLCAISSDPGFEKAFGRRADKKRRLYNGRLECQFFTYLPNQ